MQKGVTSKGLLKDGKIVHTAERALKKEKKKDREDRKWKETE